MHTNGMATGGSLEGVRVEEARLDGPGFSVRLSPTSDGAMIVVDGQPAPEQVLRLLAQNGVLAGEADRVTATIETVEGRDVYVYTPDLRHRLLFRREWNRPGRRGVFYGLNPFVADTDGPVGRVPGRASLRNVVRILSADGALARIDVMNLFTYRSANAAGLPARPEDRVAVPELERRVLRDADVVLLAWGSKARERHHEAVRDLLRVLEEVGVSPSMLERDGRLLTAGTPPQPAHPARLGHRGIRAVSVNAAAVLGGARQAEAGLHEDPTQTPSEELGRPLAAPTPARSDRTGGKLVATDLRDALAWADAHLDALGREAVRRLLAGEQHTPPHPDVPAPEELLRRAHSSGEPWDALDLAVAAHRIASGIAWRWIGARYLLDDNDLAPDLEDRRGDGKKVTGKPYADAAREALTRLVASPTARGNELAPGNERGLTFGQLARRWGVSADLIGATLGPGARRWVSPGATVIIGKRFGKLTYYRVTAEGAEWTRDGG